MLIAHGNTPFVVDVAAGKIDNLMDTGIYSLCIFEDNHVRLHSCNGGLTPFKARNR